MSGSLMPVVINEWRPKSSGALLGFVNITLGALKINDVTVMSQNGR